MKKLFKTAVSAVMITCILCLTLSVCVFAKSGNKSAPSELLQDEQLIIESMNAIFTENEITREDINYDDMMKIYVTSDLLSNDNVDRAVIDRITQNAGYYYYLPVVRNGKTYYFTISKRSELTDEQKANLPEDSVRWLESRAGRWDVIQTSEMYSIENYKSVTEKAVNMLYPNAEDIYYFGCTNGSIRIIGVVCLNDSTCRFISVGSLMNTAAFNSNPQEYLKNNKVEYSFEELKSICNSENPDYNPELNNGAGMGGSDGLPIAGENEIAIEEPQLAVEEPQTVAAQSGQNPVQDSGKTAAVTNNGQKETTEKSNDIILYAVCAAVAVALAAALVVIIKKKKDSKAAD